MIDRVVDHQDCQGNLISARLADKIMK